MQEPSPRSPILSNVLSDYKENGSCPTSPTSSPTESLSPNENSSKEDSMVMTIEDSDMDPATRARFESDKRAVYKHPLFPLLALLFEKCEIATQCTEISSSESFNMDIQAFVQHQERDGKPIFSEDPDVDGLMVKAIQVLRIHLLELEKVQELCKDFCNRYITCLKNKMQSENLLRTEYSGIPSGGRSCSSPSSDGSSSPTFGMNGNSNGSNSQGGDSNNMNSFVHMQPSSVSPVSMNSVGSNQLVSGCKVYQMVQTAQGIVAQPIQVSTTQVIHGSTPLSQIGPTTVLPSAVEPRIKPIAPKITHNLSMLGSGDEEDDDPNNKRKQKRGVLPKQATGIMRSWLFQHLVHPYPTEDEKRQLASQTNLTLLQVNNWFINARRRILQPMLDSSSNESSHKAKKPKSQSSRCVQRFWPESIASITPQIPSGSATVLEVSSPAVGSFENQEDSNSPTSRSPDLHAMAEDDASDDNCSSDAAVPLGSHESPASRSDDEEGSGNKLPLNFDNKIK